MMLLSGGTCAEVLNVLYPATYIYVLQKQIDSKYAFSEHEETCKPVLDLLNSPELSAAHSSKQNLDKTTLLLK